MTWLKLADEFSDEAARAGLSDAAFRTHVEALLWVMRRETGGVLSARDVRRFAESADADQAVAELLAAHFWHPHADGYMVIHHMQHQPEPHVIAARKDAAARRQRRTRHRRVGLDPGSTAPTGETVLYRWFDADDRLLYIGITNGLVNRQTAHAGSSSWADFAHRAEVCRYETRVEAEAAEVTAIKVEKPLFNQQHNDTPEARARLVSYLVEHGRSDLLAPSVARA